MIRKASVCVCMICLSVFLVQGVMADSEYVLEKIFTSMTPVYMNGHEGDSEWIEGFDFECDILMEGDKIGTASGRSSRRRGGRACSRRRSRGPEPEWRSSLH